MRQATCSWLLTFLFLVPGLTHAAPQGGPRLEDLPKEVATQIQSYLQQGNVSISQGDYAGAREEFQKAINLAPREYHSQFKLGIAQTYHMQGKSMDAVRVLHEAWSLEKNNSQIPKLIFRLLSENQKTTELLTLVDAMGQPLPIDPTDLLNYGIARYNAKDYNDAMAVFEKMRNLFPTVPATYFYRGSVFMQVQEIESAFADFQKYIEMDPNGSWVKEAKQIMHTIYEERQEEPKQ